MPSVGPMLMGFASLGSGLLQGEGAAAQGAYQKQQYDFNAKIADEQAADALKRGDTEAKNYAGKVKQVVGTQRAALAAGGVDVNSGSAAELQSDSAYMGAKDVATIKSNAWREAWGFKVNAQSMRSQGRMAQQAGDFSRGTSLLTGGIQAVNSFYKDPRWTKKT